MKLAKKISKGIALCAALTIISVWGGVITSCSNGSEEEYQPNIKTISDVDDVTFAVTKASVGEENTNIVFTYERSENGAKEKITIKDCDIEVLFNGEKIKTINKLDFVLNEYGDFVGDNATQYQCKISIGKKVSPGDTVKVVFKSKTGDVSGEGANSAQIDKLTVSLIDNDENAGENGWYNELVESENEYKPLFPNGNVGGDNGEGQGNGDGQDNGGNQSGGSGEQGNGGGQGQGNGDNQGGGNGGSQGAQQGNGGGNQGGDGGNDNGNQTASSLELTSIIKGIVAGDDVWGSGTKTVKETDGSYTVTAAGAGEGTWGGNIAAIPVQISAGDLVGFSHIVVTGVDIIGFTLNSVSEEHPAIELKIADEKDTAVKTKIINATKLLKESKIEIPLANVEADILKDASKIILSFRGTGTVKIKDISKGKAKDSGSSSSGDQGDQDVNNNNDNNQGNGNNQGQESGGEETGETVIFNEEKEITWSDFLVIESDKFTGETPKVISIYFDCPEEKNYVSMKIAANYEDATLGDGTVVGGTLKEDDKGALDDLGNSGEKGKVVSYTPTAGEWNDKITKTGLYVNGYGVVIKKVTLK